SNRLIVPPFVLVGVSPILPLVPVRLGARELGAGRELVAVELLVNERAGQVLLAAERGREQNDGAVRVGTRAAATFRRVGERDRQPGQVDAVLLGDGSDGL